MKLNGQKASFLKMVYFIYSCKTLKIPCIHIAGLTSKFIQFERKFRDGSNFS